MKIAVRYLGLQEYVPIWQCMQQFTDERSKNTTDELWVLEHPPVFTQGQAGKAEHVLAPGDIPVVSADRGGQVTYHGPGQLVVYCLLDIERLGIGVRQLVTHIEQAIVALLQGYSVNSEARQAAPGVYVGDAKIASLGLRVRKGCSFHGLSFNVDMDLEPFTRINPCGYEGLSVTQLADHVSFPSVDSVGEKMVAQLVTQLGYNEVQQKIGLWQSHE